MDTRACFVAVLASLAGCLGPNPRAIEQAGADEYGGEGTDEDEEGVGEDACEDAYEPNQLAVDATPLGWDEVSSWNQDEFHDARVSVDASLCRGEEDWYAVPVSDLEFDDHVLRVDALVRGTSWCAHVEGCGGARLPDAPENTIAVEVYDAASMVQIAAAIASDGRVDIDGQGHQFAGDLILRVYSPTSAASFSYALHVDVRSFDGEDECDCQG